MRNFRRDSSIDDHLMVLFRKVGTAKLALTNLINAVRQRGLLQGWWG